MMVEPKEDEAAAAINICGCLALTNDLNVNPSGEIVLVERTFSLSTKLESSQVNITKRPATDQINFVDVIERCDAV